MLTNQTLVRKRRENSCATSPLAVVSSPTNKHGVFQRLRAEFPTVRPWNGGQTLHSLFMGRTTSDRGLAMRGKDDPWKVGVKVLNFADGVWNMNEEKIHSTDHLMFYRSWASLSSIAWMRATREQSTSMKLKKALSCECPASKRRINVQIGNQQCTFSQVDTNAMVWKTLWINVWKPEFTVFFMVNFHRFFTGFSQVLTQ